MRFARIVFRIAGVYGVLVLVPQYFLEARIGRDFPPAITHPEHFYGFIGVAAIVLFAQQRIAAPILAAGLFDLVLAGLFLVALQRTRVS